MKSFLRSFLMSGIPFGVFMALFFVFESGVERGLLGGLISGVMFGFVMASLSKYLEYKALEYPPDFEDETVISQGPANCIVRSVAVGGYIYLTSKQLYFQPHKWNHRTEILSLPVQHISEALSSWHLLRTRLRVCLTDGRTETFVVNNASKWAGLVNNARQSYLSESKSEDLRMFP